MKLLFLVGTLVTSAIAGFDIPAGLPNGGYMVSLDANNNTVVVPLQDVPITSPTSAKFARRGLTRRYPSASYGCTDHSTVNQADFFAAFRRLGAWCDAGGYLNPGQGIFWEENQAGVYVCNYGGPNPCSSAEFIHYNNGMETTCGHLATGYAHISDWAKRYGRDDTLARICY